ncbi:MAG TPA: DUF2058 family protein [Rhodanobacteraceae bacterium]
MADSLREQLLKSGIVKQVHENKPARHQNKTTPKAKPASRPSDDVDLARAWAMRQRAEAAERKQAQAEAEAKAHARKQLLQRLQRTLDGKTLNKPDADQVRHFEYGGKIRRVHVDAAQLDDLNAGRLAVVQMNGSYAVVSVDLAREILAFAPQHVALLVGPDAVDVDDGVPDDLTW